MVLLPVLNAVLTIARVKLKSCPPDSFSRANPGPILIEEIISSESSVLNCSVVSVLHSMITVSFAAFSGSASVGLAIVKRPAPILNAPRAARRAAPVLVAGPEQMRA